LQFVTLGLVHGDGFVDVEQVGFHEVHAVGLLPNPDECGGCGDGSALHEPHGAGSAKCPIRCEGFGFQPGSVVAEYGAVGLDRDLAVS
jgi:hypothetical protein